MGSWFEKHIGRKSSSHYNSNGSAKRGYQSEREASTALAEYQMLHNDYSDYQVYKCGDCGKWHFGHSGR